MQTDTIGDTPTESAPVTDNRTDELIAIPEGDLELNHGQVIEHGILDLPTQNDGVITEELLSEEPISLIEILNSGDPIFDIHNQVHGCSSEDPFFDLTLNNP